MTTRLRAGLPTYNNEIFRLGLKMTTNNLTKLVSPVVLIPENFT